MTGTLTVRGQTRLLSFAAAVSSFDGDEVWLDAEVKVSRGDFGMTWKPDGHVLSGPTRSPSKPSSPGNPD